jgi:arginyl-tRNA synthetase
MFVIFLFNNLAQEDSDKGQTFCIPTFSLVKELMNGDKKEMKNNTVKLALELSSLLNQQMEGNKMIEKVEASFNEMNGIKNYTPYINIYLKISHLGLLVSDILSGEYKNSIKKKNDKIMIEYSQPNTHKTFHVGHMRNASLGNSLIKLFKFQGYSVTAVNYIGDVGTHIAKCLWYYLYHFEKKSEKIEENIPKGKGKVEFLGECYQHACIELDFSYWTKFVFPGYYTAQITFIEDHPKNPSKWKVLTLNDGQYKVVCGGKGYELMDVVAHAPVGSKKGPKLIVETDFQGTMSQGFILSEVELNQSKNKDKIFIFPKNTPIGVELTEVERLKDCPINIKSVSEEMMKRNKQVRSILKKMEEKEPEIHELWKLTRKWSIDDFKVKKKNELSFKGNL